MKLTHPVGYDLANHGVKIFRTDDFKAAAKQLGIRAEDFQITVVAEIKRLVAEQRAAELAEYEQVLGARALTAAIEKTKKAKEAA